MLAQSWPHLAEFRSRIACQPEAMPAYQMDGLLIRREAFLRVGWDTAWRVGSDMEWFIRVRDLGLRVVMLSEVVFLWRIHQRNMGLTNRELGRQPLQFLKAALDRLAEVAFHVVYRDLLRDRSRHDRRPARGRCAS